MNTPLLLDPWLIPNDTDYGDQWHLNNPANPNWDIDAEDAWDINTGRDTLMGKKIYFNYRMATEGEISAIRNMGCDEVYEMYDVQVLILTRFSFSNGPNTSRK